jgi:hypothetical protein
MNSHDVKNQNQIKKNKKNYNDCDGFRTRDAHATLLNY